MNPHNIALFLGFWLFILTPHAVFAQLGGVDRNGKIKPTLVILGTYHMGTPGNNVVNGKTDDIGSPERQRQIAELIKRLERFKPTKIALECDTDTTAKTEDQYEKYLAGTYQLSKNETNQIGFRLAKESGLKRIYCADWSDFWDDPAINYEKYARADPEFDNFLKGVYSDLKRDTDAKFAKFGPLSVTDQLRFINQSDEIEREHKIYFDVLRIGRGKEYYGTNYVSWWYRRNLTILDNIVRITDSPSDRILVVFGYGHLKLLTQFAKESEFYNVESPLNYLGKK